MSNVSVDRLDIDQVLNLHASDKHSQNGYGPIYHALFAPIRHKRIRLLEVGIGTMTQGAHVSMYGHDLPGYRPGASLRAWRDFFPHGDIVGMDVQEDTMIENEERIFTMLADSTNGMQMMGSLMGSYDIIIDDGSHLVDHQLATLGNLFPKVNPGGYYIIEDVNRLDPNQPRLPYDRRQDLEQRIGPDAMYFVVTAPKADVVVIMKRPARRDLVAYAGATNDDDVTTWSTTRLVQHIARHVSRHPAQTVCVRCEPATIELNRRVPR